MPKPVVEKVITLDQSGLALSTASKMSKKDPPSKVRPPTESLSPREIEVLELLVKAFAYKEVAAGLNVSYSTVQRHIESIYRKLHVHSRTHAVSKYLGA